MAITILQLRDEVNFMPRAEAGILPSVFSAAPTSPPVGQPGTADANVTTGQGTDHPGPTPAVIQELYSADLRRAAELSSYSSEPTETVHQIAEAPATPSAPEPHADSAGAARVQATRHPPLAARDHVNLSIGSSGYVGGDPTTLRAMPWVRRSRPATTGRPAYPLHPHPTMLLLW